MNEDIYETEIVDDDIEEISPMPNGGFIVLGIAVVAGLAITGIVGVKKFIQKRRGNRVYVETDEMVKEVETEEDSKD